MEILSIYMIFFNFAIDEYADVAAINGAAILSVKWAVVFAEVSVFL